VLRSRVSIEFRLTSDRELLHSRAKPAGILLSNKGQGARVSKLCEAALRAVSKKRKDGDTSKNLLNNQINHLAYERTTDKDDEKIGAMKRRKLVKIIHTEAVRLVSTYKKDTTSSNFILIVRHMRPRCWSPRKRQDRQRR
jgi:transcriptional regulator NrdR family protein